MANPEHLEILKQGERRPGNIRIPIGFSNLFDVTGKKVTLATLKKEVRAFKRSNVINQLAQMNILITNSLDSVDDFRKVQRRLLDNFIDEETEAKLRARFGQETPERRPVFFRQQILALLRLCILECSEEAKLEPDGATPAGFALGRCCLIMTDRLVSKKQEWDISHGTNSKRRKHLGIQMASTFELYNPTKLHRALARADITFSLIKSKSINNKIKLLLSGFDLKAEFKKSTGLTIEQYRDLVFMVFAYYDTQKPEDLLVNPDLFKLHPKHFIRASRIKQRTFNSFLALDAIELVDVKAKMKTPRPVLPTLDFVVFRRWPLLEIAKEILIC